jgi:hypothetical protein
MTETVFLGGFCLFYYAYEIYRCVLLLLTSAQLLHIFSLHHLLAVGD